MHTVNPDRAPRPKEPTVNRWHANSPQHTLPAMAAYAFGSTRRVTIEQPSKPAPGEAPTSA